MVEWKTLGVICRDIIVPMRDRPKVFDGSIPWCRIEDIEGMYFNKSLSGLMVSESVIKAMNLKVYPTGTVICSCSATLGVCAINTQPLITNQTFIGLVCSEHINNRFLYYYMSTRKKELLSLSTTGTIPYVSREKFEKMVVPVPSLPEQQRIVGILDTFTSSMENLKEQISQRRKQYEYYRDQLLDLEGKEGVEMKTLGEVVSKECSLSYGIVQPGDDVPNGIPVVRPIDLVSMFVEKEGLKKTTKEISDSYKRTILKGNEILFCVRGTTGVMSLASEMLKDCNVTRGIVPITIDDKITKMFVYYQLKGLRLQKTIAEKTNGTALRQINVKDLRLLSLMLPPLSEQQRIVSILDTFEASIHNLEQQLAQREKQYEYYRNKLLTFE